MKKRVRIKDIADKAGVSTGTVDRVLHDRGRVAPNVKKRVLEVVDELGYERLFDDLFISCHMGVAKPSQDYFRHIIRDGHLPEVEEAVAVQRLVLQDRVPHLHFGNREASPARTISIILDLVGGRHPSISLAKNTDEERLHPVDPLLAILPGVCLWRK